MPLESELVWTDDKKSYKEKNKYEGLWSYKEVS